MKSLNQLKTIIVDFFKSHYMVGSVYYTDDFDFAAYPDIKYRVVQIQPVGNTSIIGKEIINRFKIMIADIEDANNFQLCDEIWSDCQRIADDFITCFGDDDFFDFYLDYNSVDMQNFSEVAGDRQSGIVFIASIRQTREMNPDAIPLI
ncbi:hypothetical protein BDD43_2847 [Mucilaginibacter gracilis]|uniref:Uncharacterized protein n=1 Tax=Mucilaginibacter gracilis TaxID=423350 RepID=A0A495J1R6_9SPHI|nr:hypothetical protein [Mucilaginibacter gracilis]RKR82662.1 hypothetical protein BDD43_2847 [Mucilaginibacter gracilis]